jgi:hypothetical protein
MPLKDVITKLPGMAGSIFLSQSELLAYGRCIVDIVGHNLKAATAQMSDPFAAATTVRRFPDPYLIFRGYGHDNQGLA